VSTEVIKRGPGTERGEGGKQRSQGGNGKDPAFVDHSWLETKGPFGGSNGGGKKHVIQDEKWRG